MAGLSWKHCIAREVAKQIEVWEVTKFLRAQLSENSRVVVR